MTESVMKQGIQTWLKDECVSVAKDMFVLPAALNSVLDAIFAKEPKDIIMVNVDYLLSDINYLKPTITEEQYHHIHSEAIKIKDVVEKGKRKLSEEEVLQVLRAIGSTRMVIPIMVGEAIAKCQCGKST